jgi:hypothetical protein
MKISYFLFYFTLVSCGLLLVVDISAQEPIYLEKLNGQVKDCSTSIIFIHNDPEPAVLEVSDLLNLDTNSNGNNLAEEVDKYLVSLVRYDSNGMPLNIYKWTEDRKLERDVAVQFKYDSIGRVISRGLPYTGLDSSTSINDYYDRFNGFVYKHFDNPTSRTVVHRILYDSWMGRIKHKEKVIDFNEDGDTLKVTKYDAKGQLAGKVVFEYDFLGRLSEKLETNESGDTLAVSKFGYNEKGDLILKTDVEIPWTYYLNDPANIKPFYFGPIIITEILYLYDATGVRVIEQSYDSNCEFQWGEMQIYSVEHKLIERSKYYSFGLSSKEKYEYNIHGLMSSKFTYSSVHSYRYQYDELWNWIRKETLIDGELESILIRDITYYE